MLAGCGGGASSSSVMPHTATLSTQSYRSQNTANTSYESTVLADSPVALYPMSEKAAGTLNDVGGNALSGTTALNATLGTASIVPNESASVTYSGGSGDGNFGHVNANSKFTITGPISVEAWVKPTAATSSYAPIVSYGSNETQPWESYLLEATGGSHFSFELALNGQPVRLNSASTYSLNHVYHVVGTYDGSTMSIYINGARDVSQRVSGTIGHYNSEGLTLGQSADYMHEFVGSIQDAAVYAKALSATQIANHYSAGGASASSSSTSSDTSVSAATVQTTNASTDSAPSSGPSHILTYQTPLTSSNTSFGNQFSKFAPYLNYAITNANDSSAVRAAGIKAGYYFDLHSVCQSNSFGACLIGMVSLPESAFAHACDGTNSRITDTHSGGVTQFITDATSSGIRQALANVVNYNAQNGSWDFGFDDDAQDLGEIYPYMSYKNYDTGASQNPAPYCNFNESSYVAGMQSYYASSGIPIIGNTLMPSGSSNASNGTKFFDGAAPLIGGMLEGIYGSSFNGPSRSKESGSIWQSEANSELATAKANRLFIGYEHVGGTDGTGIDERNYIYASLMLGFSLNSTVFAEDGTNTNSGLLVNPEALLVPTNPLVSEPSNISSLQASGGAYVREYADCYYNGSLIGACAAVVNPNSSGSVSMPRLAQSYYHTAVISGAGVIGGVDDGSLNVNGPSAPSSIGAEEAYILTK